MKRSVLGEAEVRHAFGVGAQAGAVGLVGGEAGEGDEREGDVVRALVRHPVADEIAAAARDDGEPAAGVVLEGVAPERVER